MMGAGGFYSKFSFIYRTALIAALCLPLLGACAKLGPASVNIHGVNYTADEFTYWVQDPTNKNNHGGGEMVDSFAAGGILCCYELPRKWRAGIQVEIGTIRYINPPDDKPSQRVEEIREKHLVEVPPYVDGKPGELWVVRHADGKFGVVSSDYQPDHAKWPGVEKGWPVPSLEYMRKEWDLRIDLTTKDIKGTLESIAELDSSPEQMAKEHWDGRQEEIRRFAHAKVETDTVKRARADKALLANFTGPTDPGFIAVLKKEYLEILASEQQQLKRYIESRP